MGSSKFFWCLGSPLEIYGGCEHYFGADVPRMLFWDFWPLLRQLFFSCRSVELQLPQHFPFLTFRISLFAFLQCSSVRQRIDLGVQPRPDVLDLFGAGLNGESCRDKVG